LLSCAGQLLCCVSLAGHVGGRARSHGRGLGGLVGVQAGVDGVQDGHLGVDDGPGGEVEGFRRLGLGAVSVVGGGLGVVLACPLVDLGLGLGALRGDVGLQLVERAAYRCGGLAGLVLGVLDGLVGAVLGLVDPVLELLTRLAGGGLDRRLGFGDPLLQPVELLREVHDFSWALILFVDRFPRPTAVVRQPPQATHPSGSAIACTSTRLSNSVRAGCPASGRWWLPPALLLAACWQVRPGLCRCRAVILTAARAALEPDVGEPDVATAKLDMPE
jgi:hypothetical protein